jgi:hypothetical protein
MDHFSLTLPSRWRAADLAANRVFDALERLGQRLGLKFSPDQPRIPANEPGAGRWTSGDAEIDLAGGFSPDQMDMTVQGFISAFCLGNINRVLPGQFYDKTLAEVTKLADSGDAPARSCMKLLGRDDYRKGK